MPSKLRFLSLFSGIGGKDLGLERAGMECVGQVEIDDYCNLILEKHWPFVPRWNDIRKFSVSKWRKYCEARSIDPCLDLICGGFPCQDISTAGEGAGLIGAKSGLWFHMLRIIRQFLPRWVLVENVSALRTRGADTVLSGLEALHYTCWTVVVGAEAVGAPHRRNRVWIIAEAMAYPSGERLPAGRIGSIGAGSQESMPAGGYCDSWPARLGEQQRDWEPRRVLTQQSLGSDFDGIPERLVRLNNSHALKAYGNAAVPDVVFAIGKAITARQRGLI